MKMQLIGKDIERRTNTANTVPSVFFFFNGELTVRKFFENFDKSPVPRIFDGELTGEIFFPVDHVEKKNAVKCFAFFQIEGWGDPRA